MTRKIKIPSDMVAGSEFETNGYGSLVVTKYNNALCVDVLFKVTGYKTSVHSSNIRKGAVKDKLMPSVCGVGFIGDGDFSVKNKDAYQRWMSMIIRCYSDNFHNSRPTYIGCSVCEEWHNFQNFAEWYYENYPNDGGDYQLDKDLSCYGDSGKLYSPETCIFVTNAINSEEAHAKSYRFKNPDGDVVDIYNLNKFCRENNLNTPSMCMVNSGEKKSHKGWTKAD